MHCIIANYLHGVESDAGLSVGHVGIRPKLIPPDTSFGLGEFGGGLSKEMSARNSRQ